MVQLARQVMLKSEEQIEPNNLNTEFNNIIYAWNGADSGNVAWTNLLITAATITTATITNLIVTNEVFTVRVFTTGATCTIVATDLIVIINKGTGSATTVNLPSSPTTGRYLVIKDGKGDAVTNNITITPAAGTIDGASTLVIANDYNAATLVYNGTQWNEISQMRL